jgi:hypothetical protein
MLWEKETDLERKMKAPVMFRIPGEEATRARGRVSRIPPATKSNYSLRLAGYYRLQRQKRLHEQSRDLAMQAHSMYLALVQATLSRQDSAKLEPSALKEAQARSEALLYLAHKHILPHLPPPADDMVDKALEEYERNREAFDSIFYVKPV